MTAPTLRAVAKRASTCLTGDAREAIVSFVIARRQPDGGFAGRADHSDLYYTLFGAGALEALGRRRSLLHLPGYLKRFGAGETLDFVHLACLAQLWAPFPFHNRMHSLVGRLEAWRSNDGGYHQGMQKAACGTSYAAFLAAETYASAGGCPPDPQRVIDAVAALRVKDGGYANEPCAAQGQTNATSAACLVRLRLGLMPEPESVDFLLSQRCPEGGGFFAYPDAPMPDLLSTATALYALHASGVGLKEMAGPQRNYVTGLWTDEGGFRGSEADETPDCEYTFYALLALGALL